MKIVGEIVGGKEFINRLKALPPRLAKSIMHKAVNAAAQPILQSARQLVPQKTGNLKRMLTKKVKRYPEAVVAVVGPKNDVQGNNIRPSRYSHLVEWGHRPNTQGRLFLTDAISQNESSASQILTQKIVEGLENTF